MKGLSDKRVHTGRGLLIIDCGFKGAQWKCWDSEQKWKICQVSGNTERYRGTGPGRFKNVGLW